MHRNDQYKLSRYSFLKDKTTLKDAYYDKDSSAAAEDFAIDKACKYLGLTTKDKITFKKRSNNSSIMPMINFWRDNLFLVEDYKMEYDKLITLEDRGLHFALRMFPNDSFFSRLKKTARGIKAKISDAIYVNSVKKYGRLKLISTRRKYFGIYRGY